MAERKYRLLEPDRAVQYDALREEMQRPGGLDDRVSRLDALRAAWQQEEGSALYGDPTSALLAVTTDAVSSAMADLGFDPDHLRRAKVGATKHEQVSAQTVQFADGSALITISDAILSLNHLYSQYAGAAFVSLYGTGGPMRWWRGLQALQKKSIGKDPVVLAGLLRYHNLHQRVFALAAHLGWQPGAQTTDSTSYILLQAARFVVSHELSHHALGHDAKISAFSPLESVPICSADQQRELDADRLAYRALRRACERELVHPKVAHQAGPMTVVGALIAMMTIYATERAAFIRPGASHPTATERAGALLSHLDERQKYFAEIFVGDFLTATDLSADFSSSGRPFNWVDFVNLPGISTPHRVEYLYQITKLDEMQCQPDANLLAMLRTASLPSPAVGGALLQQGDLHGCLVNWGYSADRADQLLNVDTPLSFHTLYESLQVTYTSHGLPTAEAVAIPLISAQLFANAVRSCSTAN